MFNIRVKSYLQALTFNFILYIVHLQNITTKHSTTSNKKYKMHKWCKLHTSSIFLTNLPSLFLDGLFSCHVYVHLCFYVLSFFHICLLCFFGLFNVIKNSKKGQTKTIKVAWCFSQSVQVCTFTKHIINLFYPEILHKKK